MKKGRIKDLCPEDKNRIQTMVETLQKRNDEMNELKNKLEELHNSSFSEKEALSSENDALRSKLQSSLELLKDYQKRVEQNHLEAETKVQHYEAKLAMLSTEIREAKMGQTKMEMELRDKEHEIEKLAVENKKVNEVMEKLLERHNRSKRKRRSTASKVKTEAHTSVEQNNSKIIENSSSQQVHQIQQHQPQPNVSFMEPISVTTAPTNNIISAMAAPTVPISSSTNLLQQQHYQGGGGYITINGQMIQSAPASHVRHEQQQQQSQPQPQAQAQQQQPQERMGGSVLNITDISQRNLRRQMSVTPSSHVLQTPSQLQPTISTSSPLPLHIQESTSIPQQQQQQQQSPPSFVFVEAGGNANMNPMRNPVNITSGVVPPPFGTSQNQNFPPCSFVEAQPSSSSFINTNNTFNEENPSTFILPPSNNPTINQLGQFQVPLLGTGPNGIFTASDLQYLLQQQQQQQHQQHQQQQNQSQNAKTFQQELQPSSSSSGQQQQQQQQQQHNITMSTIAIPVSLTDDNNINDENNNNNMNLPSNDDDDDDNSCDNGEDVKQQFDNYGKPPKASERPISNSQKNKIKKRRTTRSMSRRMIKHDQQHEHQQHQNNESSIIETDLSTTPIPSSKYSQKALRDRERQIQNHNGGHGHISHSHSTTKRRQKTVTTSSTSTGSNNRRMNSNSKSIYDDNGNSMSPISTISQSMSENNNLSHLAAAIERQERRFKPSVDRHKIHDRSNIRNHSINTSSKVDSASNYGQKKESIKRGRKKKKIQEEFGSDVGDNFSVYNDIEDSKYEHQHQHTTSFADEVYSESDESESDSDISDIYETRYENRDTSYYSDRSHGSNCIDDEYDGDGDDEHDMILSTSGSASGTESDDDAFIPTEHRSRHHQNHSFTLDNQSFREAKAVLHGL